jgi:hypothetical protein
LATSLHDSARRGGAHQWAESRLYEVLGGWVATTPEFEPRLMLDRHSHHAAWRAEQWWARLPVLADVDRSELCAPPPGPAGQVADRLAGLEGTVSRLAASYRVVLPRMWAAYEHHRLVASVASDSSVLRTLAIVSVDLAADWREGEVMLQGLIRDRPAAAAAAAAAAELEQVVTGA